MTSQTETLGRPQQFVGYDSINYHLDVEVALNPDLYPSCESLEKRTGSVFQRNGNIGDLASYMNLGEKVTTLQKFQWLMQNGLPKNVNFPSLYEYLDARIAEIRDQNKNKGVFGKILQIDEKAIINEYSRMLHQKNHIALDQKFFKRNKRFVEEQKTAKERFNKFRNSDENELIGFGKIMFEELSTGNRRVLSIGPLYFDSIGTSQISVFLICAIILCFLSFIALVVVGFTKVYRTYLKV